MAPALSIALRRLAVSVPLNFKPQRFYSTTDDVRVEHLENEKIRKIILNNIKKRNPLSLEVLQRLYVELQNSGNDSNARAVIIAAEGPVFSAGHDLKQLLNMKKSMGVDPATCFSVCSQVMNLIRTINIPVIAEVKGLATAAGCQLAASCDIVVAAKSAKFSTPGATVGLFCSTPGIALSRAVPQKVAMNMLLTADSISADEALSAGLVSRVVPDDQLDAETIKVALKICSMSKTVVSIGKSFFYTQINLDQVSAYKLGESVMVENLRLRDCREGIQAFLEKRAPTWTHSYDKDE